MEYTKLTNGVLVFHLAKFIFKIRFCEMKSL